MPEDYTQWKVQFASDATLDDVIAFLNAMQFLVSTEIKDSLVSHPKITFTIYPPPS